MVLRLPDSWSNWNLETLVFEEMEKPEYLEKNLSAQMRELTTNSTHIWRRRGDSREGSLPTSLRAFQANPNLLSPQKYTSLDSYRIKKFPLWGADSKSCGFAFRIHRIRKRKVGHSKISGYAWTGPKATVWRKICVTWQRFFCQNSVMKKCFESSIAQARACPRGVFPPIKFNFRSWRQPDLSLFYLLLQSNFPCSLLGLVANLWANQSILSPKLKEKGCSSAPSKVFMSD